MFNNNSNWPPFRPTLAYQTESQPMFTSQPIHYPDLAQSSAQYLSQPLFVHPTLATSTVQQFSPFSNSTNYAIEPPHAFDPSAGRPTIWMGELEPWMDEGALRQIWSSVGFSVIPKVIYHRASGQSAGYGFIEFAHFSEAQRALNTLQGLPLPGTRKVFRLNWAIGADAFPALLRDAPAPEYSIFVGDLADGVDDNALLGLFRHYPSAHAAKVVLDAGTGRHRGYGFVRFGSESDRARALAEMPGTLLQGRPIRVSLATPRTRAGSLSPSETKTLSTLGIGYIDPSITTVFVGNLDPNACEEDLRNCFQAFGEIDHIKIPPGKGCGFVQYAYRYQAEHALAQLNGVQIGANKVRLSWGRLPADRTPGQRPRWGSTGSQTLSQDGTRLFSNQPWLPPTHFPPPLFSHSGFNPPATNGYTPFAHLTHTYLPATTSNHLPFRPPFGSN